MELSGIGNRYTARPLIATPKKEVITMFSEIIVCSLVYIAIVAIALDR